ncbi:aminotransferase-like domain-containing protein [Streptococcus porcinus]|uniref:GntR family transcriptional regulator n=2 Tax=Streptococcus porcinus TaxID=1340 RepID=A0A4V0H369_STRPO|nr:PLP-dependent aminotransferase family protein [Streptococcus porcinus]EGJ28020.1 transcriptional regulator, GntR family [Streptococcus porcinus str. Jelinkova 176]SQG44145.1 GntR family transcriptional regulator [Streptococcus porcinus]VTT43591.1 GntR family transcriptional regulator [Streptococcus porcinus]VTT44995.1 GntR family transcriptional regulator [Streptococcus porcinus]
MTSIYQKIVDDLARAIDQEKLQKGDKVPSIRRLSTEYSCSKDTVQRALMELRHRHYIYSVPKSGYYVIGKVKENILIDFNLADYNSLAYKNFKLCLNETMTREGDYLFNYYSKVEGLDALAVALEKHLADHTVYCKASEIIITSGTQQALYILSQLAFSEYKKAILLEKPTYTRMEQMVKGLGVPFETIDRTFQGLNLDQLESLFKSGKFKFFYTISRFSNPLGLSYTKEEKQAIVTLANRYDVYIIEDDYLGDFTAKNEMPLHYFDTNQKVIYLKSFSMSVFPSLRIAALVLPEKLRLPFLNHKAMIDLETNIIMQKALSLYLTNGMFERNFDRLYDYFQEKMLTLIAFFSENYPQIDYRLTPQFVILSLPSQIPMIKTLKQGTYDFHHLQGSSYLKLPLLMATPELLTSLLSDLEIEIKQ